VLRNPGPVADRLAAVADRSTLRLTHHGRRSGTPYAVTIWFMVERDTVYLVTANRARQRISMDGERHRMPSYAV
jgi:hypothetical protein